MKNKKNIFALFTIAFLSYYIFFAKQPSFKDLDNTSYSKTNNLNLMKNKNISIDKSKKSIKISKFKKESKSAKAKDCLDYKNKRNSNLIAEKNKSILRQCLRFLSLKKFNFKGETALSCLRASVLDEDLSENCLDFLQAFNSYYDVVNTPQENLEDITEETLLTSLLFSMENLTSQRSVDNFGKIFNHLNKRLPRNSTVAKASLIPYKAKNREEVIQHVQERIEKAQSLNPDDDDILGAEMFLAVTTGESNALENLEDFSKENPESGLGLIYAASIYHTLGETELAKHALEQSHTDSHPGVRKLADIGRKAIEGKSNTVGIFNIGHTVIAIPTSDFSKWVQAKNLK